MKAVLIGTQAYRQGGQDVDLICDQEFADQLNSCEVKESSKGKLYYIHGEFEATVPNEGTAYHLLLEDDWYCIQGVFGGLPYYETLQLPKFTVQVQTASLMTLLSLKKAHLILPRKWHHHIHEYGLLKEMALGHENKIFKPKAYGELYQKLYRLHRKECLAAAKAHPKLNQKKDDFFGSTDREREKEYEIFDHDSIHRAIALEDVPAYTLMLDGEVWCSRKKWRQMTEEQRFNCVREEAAILALERSIIPALYLGRKFMGAKWAYEMALFKICTTITSGFFRNYCIERYHEAVAKRPDFVKSFFEGLKSGVIEVVNREVVCGS